LVHDFLTLPLKCNIGFKGAHAIYKYTGAINVGQDNIWHFSTSVIWESLTSRHVPFNISSLVTTSPTSLELIYTRSYSKDNSNYQGCVLPMPRRIPIITIYNIPSMSPLSSKLEIFSKLNALYNFWSLKQWSLYKILLFVFHFIHSCTFQKFRKLVFHWYEVQF
jgi:hypothetical protein